jgi:hypothetical protein
MPLGTLELVTLPIRLVAAGTARTALAMYTRLPVRFVTPPRSSPTAGTPLRRPSMAVMGTAFARLPSAPVGTVHATASVGRPPLTRSPTPAMMPELSVGNPPLRTSPTH